MNLYREVARSTEKLGRPPPLQRTRYSTNYWWKRHWQGFRSAPTLNSQRFL